jgi:hypothetical protein
MLLVVNSAHVPACIEAAKSLSVVARPRVGCVSNTPKQRPMIARKKNRYPDKHLPWLSIIDLINSSSRAPISPASSLGRQEESFVRQYKAPAFHYRPKMDCGLHRFYPRCRLESGFG